MLGEFWCQSAAHRVLLVVKVFLSMVENVEQFVVCVCVRLGRWFEEHAITDDPHTRGGMDHARQFWSSAIVPISSIFGMMS